MEHEPVAPDRDFLAWALGQPPVPHHKLASLCPDFLVISPAKTGSTWLAANLRRHPQLFVPDAKEIKYFSSLFTWLDLGWYLDQFAPAGGRAKGEASPSYALLPVERIRLVRRLMPDVKLVFLMRDPVSRAWSHARHNHRYREANFAGGAAEFGAVTDREWRENFAHDWPLASGDYLGQLRRWLSVFPREQLYVGFYESVARDPRRLLRDVFAFLSVRPDVDFADFPVAEKVLAGAPGELRPALRQALEGLLGNRSRELAAFLRERLGLAPPPEWRASLEAPAGAGVPAAFRRDSDDRYLLGVLAQEEAFAAPPILAVNDYRGYNLVFYRGRVHALAEDLGRVCLDQVGEGELARHQERGLYFTAPSLAEAKERVDRHHVEQARGQLARLERGLAEAVDYIRRVEGGLRKLEAEAVTISPLRSFPGRLWRKAWPRLRAALKARLAGGAASAQTPG